MVQLLELLPADEIAARLSSLSEAEAACRRIDEVTGNVHKCVKVLKRTHQRVEGIGNLLRVYRQYAAVVYSSSVEVASLSAFLSLPQSVRISALLEFPRQEQDETRLSKRIQLLDESEVLPALSLLDDSILLPLLSQSRTVAFPLVCELALERGVRNPRQWAAFFVSSCGAAAVRPAIDERHLALLAEITATCSAGEVPQWLELMQQADRARVARRLLREFLPSLEPCLADLLRNTHSRESTARLVREAVNLDNLRVVRTMNARFPLIPCEEIPQLAYCCIRNELKTVTVPPLVSAKPLEKELIALVKETSREEKAAILAEIQKNKLPLDYQLAIAAALEESGCKSAEKTRVLCEQKLALWRLLGNAAVFDCTSEGVLTETVLDSLQSASSRSIDWLSLFSNPHLFAISRAALSQTVQIALRRDMEMALQDIRSLLAVSLPPSALAELYAECIATLTKQKDTMFAAKLGRVLEENLSEYMTVADRNLVASLNLAIAMEISESVSRNEVELAASRCLLYEGLPQSEDGIAALRKFLEARTGLPFARDALEKLGQEKGWRSYWRLFGR